MAAQLGDEYVQKRLRALRLRELPLRIPSPSCAKQVTGDEMHDLVVSLRTAAER